MTFQLLSFLLLMSENKLEHKYLMFLLRLPETEKTTKWEILFFCFSPVDRSIFIAYLCSAQEAKQLHCAILYVAFKHLNYDSFEVEFGLKL